MGTRAHRTSLWLGDEHLVVHRLASCVIWFIMLNPLTLLVQARVIWRLHVHHAHMLPKQLDDLIQLFVVAVAVHEDFKL